MRRRTFVIALIVGAMFSIACGDDTPAGKKLLFIGNSLTYVTAIPQTVGAMLASRDRKWVIAQKTIGGATLDKHWNLPDGTDAKSQSARQMIDETAWDFVVLQDQSAQPAVNPTNTLDYAKRFCEKIKARGATPIFYGTWGVNHDASMLAKLTVTYVRATKDNNGVLAPVGLAFAKAYATDPTIELFQKDGKHPSAQGGYLSACVFFTVLSGESPVGLPAHLETAVGGKSVKLADLPPTTAATLQKAAWEAVSEMHAKIGVPTMVTQHQAAQ
ncbi:MAG: hypothetical protein GC162_03945 [Planctomycetes bacterium]|nr:hypothetical protein [Planctomycetota bacterium]